MRHRRVLCRIGTVVVAHVIVAVPAGVLPLLLAVRVTAGAVRIAAGRGVVVVICGSAYRWQYAVFAVGECFFDETEPADPDCHHYEEHDAGYDSEDGGRVEA